ncbi:hypothetical protein EON80_08240 [bacterium]|nr:MAG: hypothetical protein EON80_08240 [bacterium]
MKSPILLAGLILGIATYSYAGPSNHAQPQPQRLHFARGTNSLVIKGHLGKRYPRPVYIVKTQAGQRLTIRAQGLSKSVDKSIVPLIFVTPPQGKYDGDKTAEYHTDSTKAGDYRIEVGVNQMATNAHNGPFELRVYAH